jgi:hypothetical protein
MSNRAAEYRVAESEVLIKSMHRVITEIAGRFLGSDPNGHLSLLESGAAQRQPSTWENRHDRVLWYREDDPLVQKPVGL